MDACYQCYTIERKWIAINVQNNGETLNVHYSNKLSHVQVVINCPYSVAHLCTREDTLAHNLGALYFDDVMSYNSLTTGGYCIIQMVVWLSQLFFA